MNKSLLSKIRDLPKKPGVYVFKDQSGEVLYVGKAVNLKSRVSSYSRQDAGKDSARIQIMISQIVSMDYTVTDNETESLILENNFIKQLKPKYNVMLRDDKNYLFVKINLQDEIPTIEYDRKISDRTSRYFGPYTSATSIRDTLKLLRRIFPYCANAKIGSKPCFFYHIGKCPGVCFGKISPEEYKTGYINKIIQFLEGRQTQLAFDLKQQMKKAAQKKQFEKAAKLRDQLFALNRVFERQKLVYPKKISQDVFGLWQENVASINLFIVREGKLIQKENFILENAKQASAKEIFESFLPKYYLEASSAPKEIVLPVNINREELQQNITITIPKHGKKRELLKLAEENAKQYLESQTDKHLLEEARLLASLKELQRVLTLPTLPGRIEAYDISNIQGTNPVGSMVVFDYARPKKQDYRKFKISAKGGSASGGNPPIPKPDDFAMMGEVLERRFSHSVIPAKAACLPDGQGIQTTGSPIRSGMTNPLWPLPDLILIDGGKGQLNAAIAAMRHIPNSKFQIPIIGLAKRLEEIFMPGKSNPIILPSNSIALFLLQRIRDEAHRFAIKFHRQLRSKSSLASELDKITGIGPAKKKILLQKFKSASKIKQAEFSELANAVGKKLAQKIKTIL